MHLTRCTPTSALFSSGGVLSANIAVWERQQKSICKQNSRLNDMNFHSRKAAGKGTPHH
jgi:hypothetical protein